MYSARTRRVSEQQSPMQVSPPGLDEAIKRASGRAMQYEYQMKDLESKLAENLSNFRAIDSLLQEAFLGLQSNSQRAERALNIHVPHIYKELDQSNEALTDLADRLPTIRTQVAHIHTLYDSGRAKAQHLVSELEWLNTDFYERWRAVIFTTTSPVSWRWKAFMRFLFLLSFLACTWMAWIVLRGAYRAHRHRLVWGERLMS
ncbi:hypothetical protein PLICRDRAFT_43006 [Plicaturopsis crispa FD-325 SS-3]|nr:hypothetical protein PLICRDRAFT_43006 [Plicaturopsis crispa FD-325 SS-3]